MSIKIETGESRNEGCSVGDKELSWFSYSVGKGQLLFCIVPEGVQEGRKLLSSKLAAHFKYVPVVRTPKEGK